METHKQVWRERTSYLFLLPILVVYIVFSIYPIIQTFVLSFHDSNIVNLGPFVGFDKYARILSSPLFVTTFVNTLVFTSVSIVFTVGIALLIAVLLDVPKLRFRTLFKVVFFLPVVTSPVAIGYVWKWMYEPQNGIINEVLSSFGIVGPSWLSNPDLALWALIVVNIWRWIGYFMVILFAHLQLIDDEYYDSADIDGAGALQKFRYITVPLLRTALSLCVLLGIVAFMRAFALVFVMTRGGPSGRTELMVTYIYQQAFGTGQLEIGLSAAASMILFLLIAMMTIVSSRISRARS